MTQRILYFISETFPPLGRGGPLVAAAFARYLARDGWRIKAVTSGSRKGFFLRWEHDYAEFEAISKEVEVREVLSRQCSFIHEMLVAAGLVPSLMTGWARTAKKSLPAIVDSEAAGIAYAMYPDIANLWVAEAIKQQYGLPLVLNLRDMLPGGMAGHVRKRKWWYQYEHPAITAADLIFVATRTIRDDLMTRHDFPEERIEVIYNGYDEPAGIIAAESHEQFRVVYAGTMARAQRPELLNLALRRLLAEHPELTGKIVIDFYGQKGYYYHYRFKPTLTRGAVFRGFMPHAELMKRLAQEADAGFFSLADEDYAYATPSKLFEFINLEKPVLAACPRGEAWNIIENKRIGLVCHYSDTDKLAENLYTLQRNQGLYQELAANVRRVKPEFSIQTQVKKMSGIMRERLA